MRTILYLLLITALLLLVAMPLVACDSDDDDDEPAIIIIGENEGEEIGNFPGRVKPCLFTEEGCD